MATVSIASLGLGNADLTVIGKLSETGLSQTEVVTFHPHKQRYKPSYTLIPLASSGY